MADSGHDDLPTCFVAMPVTTPSNYAEKLGDTSHFPHVLDHLFTPALTKARYRVIAPTSRGAQLIHAEIIKNLERADLVLCDLSSLNANVFFELGIRTSLDRPVVLVKDRITERIPFDLNAINTHTYNESLAPWTLSEEIDQLAEHIKAVDTGAGSGNNMWHYFGLTKRATPAEITGNPTEAKLDLLLAEITALKIQGGQRENVLSVVREQSPSTSEKMLSNSLTKWFTDALLDLEIKDREFVILRRGDGFRVVLSGPIGDNEMQLLEQAAQKYIGKRVTIEVI